MNDAPKKRGPDGVGGTCYLSSNSSSFFWPPFYNKAEPYWIGIPFFSTGMSSCGVVAAVFNAAVCTLRPRRRGN